MAENTNTIELKNLPEFLQRMATEHNELHGRIQRAIKFLQSDDAKKLTDISRNLLATQVNAMQTYDNVLLIRLNHEIKVFQIIQQQAAAQAKDTKKSSKK